MWCGREGWPPGIGRLQSLFQSVRMVVGWNVYTNYRGISQLSVVGKVFARVLKDGIKGLTEGSIWMNKEVLKWKAMHRSGICSEAGDREDD